MDLVGHLNGVTCTTGGLCCFAMLLFLGEYPSLCVRSMHAVRAQCKNLAWDRGPGVRSRNFEGR